MVYLITPENCDCETCNGGTPAPPGNFGGSHCCCPCHNLQGIEREDYIRQKKKWLKKVHSHEVTEKDLEEIQKLAVENLAELKQIHPRKEKKKMSKAVTVYVVSNNREFVGIASSMVNAESMCIDETYYVTPLKLNQSYEGKNQRKTSYYPKKGETKK